MMPPAANRHPNGFTLIEVVIALTVLGFLFVGLAQGVRFGLVAWSAEMRRTGGDDDFRTLDNTLRHVIEGIDPGDDLNPARFVATSDWLDCITALPYASGATPSRQMRATLKVDADHRLVLRWWPSLHARRLRPQPRGADRDRIAARRFAHRVGVLAAGRQLGQQLAVSGPARAGARPPALPARRSTPLA